MGSQPIRVVYLLGSARSGSTILSAILGTHPDIAAVGELSRLTFDVEGKPRICSCGKLVWQCERWHQVREDWSPRLEPWTIDDYTRTLARYSRPAQAPSLLWAQVRASPGLQALLDSTPKLLESIQSALKRSIIVDSSKSLTRALMYAMIPNLDLRIVHLVRDVRGYVWSRSQFRCRSSQSDFGSRSAGAQVVFLAIRWNLMNLASEWAARRSGSPRMQLRYEDFVTSPRSSLLPLGEFMGVDLQSVVEQVEGEDEFDFDHIVSGNLVRLTGPTRVNFDETWRHALTRSQQQLIWLSGLPFSSLCGYPP